MHVQTNANFTVYKIKDIKIKWPFCRVNGHPEVHGENGHDSSPIASSTSVKEEHVEEGETATSGKTIGQTMTQ